jgi:CBS domain containing-hemolysin-like protein
MDGIVGLLMLLLLILMNAFFVAAEYSLVSVRRTRIDQLADDGNALAKRVQRALGNLNFYIAAVQLGITVAALATGYVAEPALGRLIEPGLRSFDLSASTVQTISVVAALAISTVLSVIFAELVPKSITIARAEQVAFATIIPLQVFSWVFGPLAQGLNWIGGRFVRLFGVKPVDDHRVGYSEEEIRMIVQSSSQQGVLEADEKELLNNVFDFSDTSAREIMTPRVDMIGIEASETLHDLVALNAEHGYSRFPVYRETNDKIIGVAHMADVLKHLNRLDAIRVEAIARPTYFAPEGMKVIDLFKNLQTKKMHMAVVVDEFGGTAGVVTLEDVLEELVGEIYDETDEEEEEGVQKIDPGVYIMDASLKVDEVEDVLGIDLDDDEEGEFDTLSGFVYHQFGYIPQQGEEIEFQGWIFHIEAADERRVSSVRVSKRSDPLEANAGDDEPVQTAGSRTENRREDRGAA